MLTESVLIITHEKAVRLLYLSFDAFIGYCTIKTQKLANAVSGDLSAAVKFKQVEEWLMQSNEYVMKTGELKADLDKAIELADRARQLSKALRYTKGYNDALEALSLAYIEKGSSYMANEMIKLANDSTKVKILLLLEDYHYQGGQITQSNDSALYAVERALPFLQSHKYPQLELTTRAEIMYLSVVMGNDKKVEEQYAQAMNLKGKVPVEEVILMHHCLGIIYIQKGNNTQALRFALEGLQLSEQNKRFMAERMYSLLGTIYKNNNEPAKCIEAHSQAMAINKANKQIDRVWIACEFISTSMAQLRRYDEGISLIYATEKEVGFSKPMDKALYYRALGRTYEDAGNIDQSDKAFYSLASLVDEKKLTDLNTFQWLCKFFLRKKEYERCRYYMDKAFLSPNVGDRARIFLYKTSFSLDSAAGNYEAATKTLLKLQVLQDSVKSVEKEKHLNQLLVQYETEKKDKELQLKQQDIELLSRESLLKQKDLEHAQSLLAYETEAREKDTRLARISATEKDKSILLHRQNIDLLKKDADLKQSIISKAGLTRDIMILGACMLLVILLLLYKQYRFKQKTSMALAQKNKRLEVLVGEKELLLKEVHHRVKNNLHTIISLLESQAHFLSDEALMAVQQSQHRVYAMSLIHQKLYQHEQATTVKMDQYFAELLLYFKDSFELGDKISFQVQMDAVELDISEAIPIGLILNEAITNAIKYAFINRQKGIVYISLQQSGPSHIRLRISDNGVGLPPGWESKINQSLGIKLMRGLSDEIHAAFNITSDGGTSISVDFEKSSFEMNAVA